MIVDEYHNDQHTGIGMSPLEKFKSYYFGPHGQKHRLPPVYVDNLQFRTHWFPLVTRTIQRYGIRIDYLDYYSESLAWLVRNRKNYQSIEIRRHPFDVRVIYFKHPDRKAEDPDADNREVWIPVQVRYLGFPIASLYELRAARREALRRKRSPTPALLAKIIDEQHQHIEEAVKKTKTAQREASRRSHHDRIRAETPKAAPNYPVKPTQPQPSGSQHKGHTLNNTISANDGNLSAILAGISDDDVEAMFE